MMDPTQLPHGLPPIDPERQAHCEQVARALKTEILQHPKQMIPFERWMEVALYAPGLGYYTVDTPKLDPYGQAAKTGDFTTSPELTPLFGATVATQAEDIMAACGTPAILEFGAGSGALADSVLAALANNRIQPRYYILEVSPALQQQQRQRLARYGDQVQWLSELPDSFQGCVLANEVLDAMPVTLFTWENEKDGSPTLKEYYVTWGNNGFEWCTVAADDVLQNMLASRMPPLPNYRSEINRHADAWIRSMGSWLTHGAALLFDYGFPQHEYYHPQRHEGTLMCHFRHHSHSQALIYPGGQDITAHIDFTAMADAALAGGLEVVGYTSQAQFLINAGLLDQLQAHLHAKATVSAVQTLLSAAEMGELFKVMALASPNLDINFPLRGFQAGDRRHLL